MPRKSVAEPGVAKKKKTVRKRAVRAKAVSTIPAAPVAAPSLAHGHAVHHAGIRLAAPKARRQRLTVTLGIVVIMSLIVTGWILNLRRVIGSQVEAAPKSPETRIELEGLRQELSNSLREVKSQIGELNEIHQEAITSTAAPTSAVPPSVTQTESPAVLPQ